MYEWRKMSDEQRAATAKLRRVTGRPMHSPAHRASDRTIRYHITAACFEHRTIIGAVDGRLAAFSAALLEAVGGLSAAVGVPTSVGFPVGVPTSVGAGEEPPEGGTPTVLAWAVLPNHYHLLVATQDILWLLRNLGRLHGRTSYQWNGEDGQRGRQVWCKAAETAMKSDRHAHATMNYIHNNPVKHGLVTKWQDWPYSSAKVWLESVGRETAERFWIDYPVTEYGKAWDL